MRLKLYTIALGAGFANENAIFKIIGAPERWPIVEGQIRRCLILKFSYAIFYIEFIPIES
jgi:hypothetical protein